MSTDKPKRNWIVTMRCTIRKEVYCEDCTEDEARNEPFEYAVQEDEVDQEDWEVLKVQVNE